ncbi:MAG: PD40 domain-containing protein [Prolixibacteraceae bacterium]|nr:PD40 domain-containing protein [Prolixibacteraceae bacterium]
MKKELYIIVTAIIMSVISCSDGRDIEDFIQRDEHPLIFPDYTNITVPPNIAPLNFYIDEDADAYRVKLTSPDGSSLIINSDNGVIKFPFSRWKKILKNHAGRDLVIDVFVKKEKTWNKYQPFNISISNDEIDSHLAYRLINVGYILWKKMGLYMRDVTSFEEKPIMVNRNTGGNCMNCHSFCKGNPEKAMFHMRAKHAGTMIFTGDSIKKINTKTPYTMSAGVYPSWHPDGKHIAYSIDIVNQWFHGVDKRNEVYDKASDIIVYNIETNTVTTSPDISTKNRETLPCWSPDGKFLYYCSTLPINDSIGWLEVKYDLLRISFNTETNEWGKPDTVLTSEDVGGSITFPRVSPDGKFLAFTRGSHGYFTIYNSTSDIYLLDLETGTFEKCAFNSGDVDSFHSWSQNSRWLVFSSKRLDGLCTRPFFTYIDAKGQSTKPFVMPQKDPLFYKSFKNNYNVPELATGPFIVNRPALLQKAKGNASPVQFDPLVDVSALSGATRIEERLLH